MFDDFPTADNARLQYHWPEKIAAGDVASFVWPGTGASNGTTATPCLVMNVIKILGCTYFELAHGAPDRPHSSAGYQIIVNREVDVLWSHLPTRFRFDCRFRVLVPPLHPNFQKVANSTPLIGRLPDHLIDRMNAVRARLAAESDIAAHYRSERMQEIAENHGLTLPRGAQRCRHR